LLPNEGNDISLRQPVNAECIHQRAGWGEDIAGAPHINDVSRRREVVGGSAPPPFARPTRATSISDRESLSKMPDPRRRRLTSIHFCLPDH